KVVSVWIFDKKDIDRWPKDDRESFLSLIRQGVSQLTKLRHPRLLVVEHPIEESRDSLAFATEPVFACLANCLCRPEHVSASSSSAASTHLNNVKFSEVEIKHGLFQLGEALSFLHIDAGILHRNVTPESVIVNDRGAWKLAGFKFSIQGRTVSPGKFAYETFNWTFICQRFRNPIWITSLRNMWSVVVVIHILTYIAWEFCHMLCLMNVDHHSSTKTILIASKRTWRS
ncbi:SCY1-like protein 2, partial [Parelaphostrongylus tenuis]